ncbi:hypothetical protein LNV08_02475 [Paucibacter sp. TC2R-5]|uniref:hypothetical protein n=1 Tax=Paucibacter sp. TC2R-5 TaxID=2893555 RepID=UPI0021E4FA95|nr:hypothetical protein [Paucibacter sp. TC2R-5]MCV2357833.1 hypothetical protein [Paucibacter sp. TC2R-5]
MNTIKSKLTRIECCGLKLGQSLAQAELLGGIALNLFSAKNLMNAGLEGGGGPHMALKPDETFASWDKTSFISLKASGAAETLM